MEVISSAKNVRISPRKARSLASALKKLPLAAAQDRLMFLSKKGTKPVLSVLKTAIADATNNFKLKAENLKIKNILVNEGLKMKRRDTSHRPGREGLIQKRTSHITIILEG